MSGLENKLSTEKFLELKWKKFFSILDIDHDGYVTQQDYVIIGQRFSASPCVPEKRRAVVSQHFPAIWEKVFNKDGKTEKVNQEELLDLFSHRTTSDMRQISDETCSLMFEAIDADGDGFIQVNEFRDFFRLFFKDDANADKSFGIIDLNKDGILSKEEFCAALTDFIIGADQKSPYQLVFGPLDA